MNATIPQTLPLDSLGPFKPVLLPLLSALEDISGLNTAALFNLGLIAAGISTFFHYAGGTLYRYAQRVCLSSVHLNDDDELYAYIMRYMAEHHLRSRSFRSVKATLNKAAGWEEEDAAGQLPAAVEVPGDKLISYRTMIGRTPIRLQPFEGWLAFRHRGHWIFFSHRVHKSQAIFQDPRERGFVQLETPGRSLAPLETLLRDAQQYHLAKSMSSTNVFRALASRGETMRWAKVLARPARDIRTVVLDRAVKRRLLRDINDYLHPRTRRWYANHGVPYRRGYLFSGAPGSGKTSLTAALAGVFGLDVYVLSLLDPALTESQLMRLFSELPARCIVLLEDVDVAGLGKRGNTSGRPQPPGPLSGLPSDLDPAIRTPLSATFQPDKKPAATSGVSLSALLNAIDGVSSSEGRVLIMTTNAPDALDRALIRPGRVDMHVAFELPARTEMEELFISMYHDPDAETPEADPAAGSNEKAKDAAAAGNDTKDMAGLEFAPSQELRQTARRFAEAIPEKTLSLASIQGFLLRFKSDPDSACVEVKEWCREAIRELEEEKKQQQNEAQD